MVVKRTLSSVTRGADLMKPRPDLQYVAAAVIGVTVLLLVYKGGSVLAERVEGMIQARNPNAPKPDWAASLGIL